MVTILLQKILDLLKENLSNMIKFFVTDPQDGQALVYDAESEEWKNDFVDIELQETASGSVATFDTEATMPLVSLKANITAQQAGSGTPSPSNPRAISGFSSVTLTQKDSEDNTVDTFTIALGDTYYGGVLDCKNGTATITHIVFEFDGSSDESWSNVAASDGNRANTISLDATVGQPNDVAIIANEFSGVSYNDRSGSNVNTCYVSPSRNLAIITSSEYDTAEKFKTFLSNNNLTVVVQLATPITLTGLTPDNFTTIAGQNNIFANSGDVEVVYNTSSAQKVWDISNHVKNLTSGLTIDYLTIEESSCAVKAYQQGHMVIVEINFMKFLSIAEETHVLITGLPKPVEATCGAVLDTYDYERGIRLRVNTDGELQLWYCRPAGNHEAVGQIVYITDEV